MTFASILFRLLAEILTYNTTIARVQPSLIPQDTDLGAFRLVRSPVWFALRSFSQGVTLILLILHFSKCAYLLDK